MVCQLPHLPESVRFSNNRLFAGISPEVLSEVGTEMGLLSFEEGDIIFREGDPGDVLYLVGEGSVRISKRGRGGEQETLGFIKTGNFFGEMALLDGQPRSAQATAAEKSVLGAVDERTFQAILEQAPSTLHMNFLRSAVERLRGVNSHFITEVMRNERLSLLGTMANSIIHDLKSPIGVVHCCADLLASRMIDPSCIEITGLIKKSVDGMIAMTQELLDFARGQTSLKLETVPLANIVEELSAHALRVLPQQIHFSKEATVEGSMLVDLGKLVRVFSNLVKNAMEAMPKGGVAKLRARVSDGELVLAFADTGCGIPPEIQASLFEPFVTLGKTNGTGVGMAIAKSVVEAHRGKIAVQSTVGCGTTVTIRIPISTQHQTNNPPKT